MAKQAIVALGLLETCGIQVRRQETVTALPEQEMPPILAVTGFHSGEDKANKLEIRLLEVDSSGDVARNPVALFLVITDNTPSDDSQTHIWRLPEGVSVVKKLTTRKGGAEIFALVDGQTDEKTGRFPTHDEVIHIAYTFANGMLSGKIRVVTSKP